MTEEDWPVEVALSATPDVVEWTYYPAGLDEAAARARLLRQQARAAEGLVQRYVVRDGTGTALGTCGSPGCPPTSPRSSTRCCPPREGAERSPAAVLALVAWAASAGYASVALMTVEGNAASERGGAARRVHRARDEHGGAARPAGGAAALGAEHGGLLTVRVVSSPLCTCREKCATGGPLRALAAESAEGREASRGRGAVQGRAHAVPVSAEPRRGALDHHVALPSSSS
ncbi:MAG: hypothetical protein PGN11_11835 [Quadrisphaera sp.]